MKKLLLLTLLITGCTVDIQTIDKAYELCKDNGGLSYIHIDGSTLVHCSNGAGFSL